MKPEDDSESGAVKCCETPGCDKEAKLQCPTCIKLQIKGSFFCGQPCFQGNWDLHKALHKLARGNTPSSCSKPNKSYNPWPGYVFSGKLRPAEQSAKRFVPDHIPRPDYADHPEGYPISEQKLKGNTYVKQLDDEEIESLRVACKLGREVLDEGFKAVAVGVTTDEIDRVVHEASVDRNCYPSPLNYYQFPKSCCTSVNEVICHGIPDKRPLQDGDIVNVDVTVYHRGYHGDLNESFFVGKPKESAKKLVKNTWECLEQAMEMVKPGVKFRDVGNVIQKHAQSEGFSVVRSYCGHGIHKLFHCAPNVPHYAKNKAVGVMKQGQTFTIEPMISEGVWTDETWPDNWTAVTGDGRLSAQFEQTMVVTDKGVEVLTARPGGKANTPHFMDQLEAMK